MKKVILMLCTAALSASALAVDEAEYDVTTKILTIPSIKIGAARIYDGQLQLNNEGLFVIVGYSETPTSSDSSTFTLTSSAIENCELLSEYKCEQKVNNAEDSIPLAWSNVPTETGSLAVTMHHYPNSNDTSSPNSYLLLWNIDPAVTEIAHGAADDGPWYMGANKDGVAISYTSPCSPSAGTHEYTLTVYALSETPASLPVQSSVDVTYDVLTQAIATVDILGTATLTFNDVTESFFLG
ncbi:MAG: hypothetical protein DRR19_17070 [Candidatus Parabeggiatoa sp. nov. 1]|nr:MAG: hypothetical protein DRR19_17070 [Gammaproteobacteria bacterium]